MQPNVFTESDLLDTQACNTFQSFISTQKKNSKSHEFHFTNLIFMHQFVMVNYGKTHYRNLQFDVKKFEKLQRVRI